MAASIVETLKRHPALVLIVLTGISAVLGWWVAERVSGYDKASDARALLLGVHPNPRQLTGFTLTDHQGRVFDLERLKGHWTLLFFGYTYCPDICPTALGVIAASVQRLRDTDVGSDDPQVVFVSVDPQRDDLPRLGTYVAHFDKSFIGATGSEAQIDVLAQQVNVFYMKDPGSPDMPLGDDYLMRHSSSILVIDPEARWRASFPPPHDAARIADKLVAVRQRYRSDRG